MGARRSEEGTWGRGVEVRGGKRVLGTVGGREGEGRKGREKGGKGREKREKREGERRERGREKGR